MVETWELGQGTAEETAEEAAEGIAEGRAAANTAVEDIAAEGMRQENTIVADMLFDQA